MLLQMVGFPTFSWLNDIPLGTKVLPQLSKKAERCIIFSNLSLCSKFGKVWAEEIILVNPLRCINFIRHLLT